MTSLEVMQCLCGCGEDVNPGRLFRSGHDQRLRGKLLRRFDEGDEEAGKQLVAMDWYSREELEDRRTAEELRRKRMKARQVARAERRKELVQARK